MRILLFALLVLGGNLAFAMPQDSIGVRYVNGQKCIVHEVEKKETLYAISKHYNVKVEDLKKWNSLPDAKIKKGQQLYIMIAPKADASKTAGKQTYHIVQKGEGLWSISKQYGVTIPDLKDWNNLESDGINEGQKLIVVAPEKVKVEKEKQRESKFHTVAGGETLFSIARMYEMSVEELKNLNSMKNNDLKIGQILIVKAEKGKPVHEEKSSMIAVDAFKRISEEGVATPINRAEYNTKFSYCLHKTAPIGTIIKVMNEKTGEYMYAKVMGTLPPKEKSIIKVNETVKNKIGKGQDSFNVKLSYIL